MDIKIVRMKNDKHLYIVNGTIVKLIDKPAYCCTSCRNFMECYHVKAVEKFVKENEEKEIISSIKEKRYAKL